MTTKAWYREDTKKWIEQVYNRLDDLDWYLGKTYRWCEDNSIFEQEKVFTLSFITCVWVSSLRGEAISRREIMEKLNIEGWEDTEDFAYSLGHDLAKLDYEEMLEKALEVIR